MMSMETHIGRLMSSHHHEEARRLMYLRPSLPVPQSNLSSPREDSLAARRGPMDHLGPSHHLHHHQQQQQHQLQQRIRCQTLSSKRNESPSVGGPPSAVSRRNARERKRVRLVNLGFSTLRERVPPGSKNKKLSKVETLRAAIEYIRQLQQVLGIPDQHQDLQGLMLDENYGPDDCSSVASSEEILQGPGNGGSVELSPASSHPSDCSLVSSSPYTSHHAQDDHLLDIGVWFS